MVATAWTTTTKMTGATIILTRAMNQSLSGFTAAPTVGHRRPTAMPSTAAISDLHPEFFQVAEFRSRNLLRDDYLGHVPHSFTHHCEDVHG